MLRDLFNKARQLSFAELRQGTRTLIVTTPAEIYIGAALGLLIAATGSYKHEAAKRGQIPVAYSEIETTELYVEKIQPLTRFYSVVNDVLMQVFEANDIAYESWGGKDYNFAFELEKKIDPSFRIHTLITDYAKLLPGYAQEALKSVSKLADAEKDLAPIIDALDGAWSESHHDVTKTVHTTREECHGSGKDRKCETIHESHQEYDYTIHSYRYNAEQGALAAGLIPAFIRKYPDVQMTEKLLMAWETSADNEYMIRQSRRHMPGYVPPKGDEYLKLANTWATGSNYIVLTPKIDEEHAAFAKNAPDWLIAKETSRNHRYTSYSHSDSGPKEFRVAEKALGIAKDEAGNIRSIVGGIESAGAQIPLLTQKIEKFVNITLHGEQGSARGLRGQIMREARDLYDGNYAAGFDVQPSNWYMMGVWGFLGLLVGGGIGFGADLYIDRKSRGGDGQRRAWNNGGFGPR